MADEINMEQPAEEELNVETLETNVKDNAYNLGIIVENGLEEDAGNLKKCVSALLAGVALNAIVSGNALGNVDCIVDRQAENPTIKCKFDPEEIHNMPDELVRKDVKDLFQDTEESKNLRNLLELPDEVANIKFVKFDDQWQVYLDIGYGDMTFSVDPTYFAKLDDGYKEELAGLSNGDVTYDDDLEKSFDKDYTSAEEDMSQMPESVVEESLAIAFAKCLTEMVEKNTYNREEMRKAFIKAIG